MKYLLVYIMPVDFGFIDLKPKIMIYDIEGLKPDIVNALIDLVYNHQAILIDKNRKIGEETGKIKSNGKILQINKDHPYALCNEFRVI